MKKTIYILFILFQVYAFGQYENKVGINTDKPTRKLDVNGNLKITTLTDKTSDPKYTDVLITDANGNVDKVPISLIKNQISQSAIEVKRLFYTSQTPDADNRLSCGRFKFSFRPGGTDPNYPNKNLDIMVSLVDEPATPITVFYLLFRKWGDNDLKYYKSNGKDFNASNYTTPQLLCPQLDINSFGEFYITYPGEENFYRVNFLGRPNYVSGGNTYNSYTITCEKF